MVVLSAIVVAAAAGSSNIVYRHIWCEETGPVSFGAR